MLLALKVDVDTLRGTLEGVPQLVDTLRDAGAGFNHDTNKVTILYRNNKADHFQLKSKKAVAEDIVVAMARHWGLDEQPQAAG